MSVLELFCAVDDFCQAFEPKWHQHCLSSGNKQRHRRRELALSEIMTILILFHQSHYRTFKAFYTDQVCRHLGSEFPTLVSAMNTLGDRCSASLHNGKPGWINVAKSRALAEEYGATGVRRREGGGRR